VTRCKMYGRCGELCKIGSTDGDAVLDFGGPKEACKFIGWGA